MDDARVKSSSGERELVFSDAKWDGSELAQFTVSIRVEGMTASTGVYAYGPSPAVLFEEMAREWRGWKGTKEWASLEGEVAFVATHDGRGTITLNVRLAHVGARDRDWEARADLELDAGAQLESTLTTVRAFFSP